MAIEMVQEQNSQEKPVKRPRKAKGREGMQKKTVWLTNKQIEYIEQLAKKEFRPIENQLEMIVHEAIDRKIENQTKSTGTPPLAR